MDAKTLMSKISSGDISVPMIKAGQRLHGVIQKKVENGVLVSCADGAFIGFIYEKELRELQKAGVDVSVGAKVEAEIVSTSIKSEDNYYILSVIKLLQYDVWDNLLNKSQTDEVFKVVPTEANLGGLMVDMYGIKGFIPLSQLAPIHYPRVEDGDEEKIFQHLLELIGTEFEVRVISIDQAARRIVLSEREALREEREKILEKMEVGNEYDGTISGISSYGYFVTIGGGIEGLVHISEITYGHVENIDRFAKVGDPCRVKVIGYESNKISFSVKQLKPDPWTIIPNDFKEGDVISGQVIRFVPYGVFMRVYEDINGLIHLSELPEGAINDPAKKLKFGQVVNAKIITLDAKHRKIGLTMKNIDQTGATLAA